MDEIIKDLETRLAGVTAEMHGFARAAAEELGRYQGRHEELTRTLALLRGEPMETPPSNPEGVEPAPVIG